VSVFDESVTIFGHWKLSVLSLIRAFMGARMGARMRSVHAGTGHQNSLEAARVQLDLAVGSRSWAN